MSVDETGPFMYICGTHTHPHTHTHTHLHIYLLGVSLLVGPEPPVVTLHLALLSGQCRRRRMQHERHELIASCPVFACARGFTLHLIHRRIVRQN